jgi:hypothetical protein
MIILGNYQLIKNYFAKNIYIKNYGNIFILKIMVIYLY